MRFTVFAVITFADDSIIQNNNSAHHRVRAYVAFSQFGKLEAALHIFFMLHHAAKVAFMLLCSMKTIHDVFTTYKSALAGIYEPQELEAVTLLVISEINNLSKAKIKAFPETELSTEQAEKLTGI